MGTLPQAWRQRGSWAGTLPGVWSSCPSELLPGTAHARTLLQQGGHMPI